MALINLRKIQLGFGGPLLLDGLDLAIERGERICLLGRNGAGKSTLMKLLAGELHADDGEFSIQQGAVITRLTQEVPDGISGTVFDVVATGLGELGELVRRFHHIVHQLETDGSEKLLEQLSRVQHDLEAADGWQSEQRVETVISKLSLDSDIAFSALSGGLKRRVLLARALVQAPDLLLLDEPTNHLDIASIDWLEEFLLNYEGTLLFVTHDRMFLRKLATRIIELDRGRLTDWPGDYENFMRRKAEMLNAEEKANARFDKKLAQEEVWIRQGIKARRTRNEGRVRALQAMRAERVQRRERSGNVNMALQQAERSGKLVVEVEGISYAWDGVPIVKNFSTTIMRGDRIGIIGPNGAGKTTLLNLLLGKLQPTTGTVKHGTKLEVAYFDQLRAQLDDEKSVIDNVADGSDKVEVNGTSKHVISYLQDFLFAPDRVRQPVKALSGGERNRLLLARLFTKSANVLVMDEPTNDLDVETLELLEELLLDYKGTLLLVSHDRVFLNNVVTSTLVFEGEGEVNEYVGGYDDWLHQRKTPAVESNRKKTLVKAEKTPPPAIVEENKPKKLSYKDQRELDALPKLIEQLEAEIEQLQLTIADPAFYKGSKDEMLAVQNKMQEAEAALTKAYARWEILEP
ncbi:MAG: ATP-binding cassette domain-containing protein [Sedimenticola thiotaurini]|uniref:ATP-binding protein Uup n=1 Tax=Sedimenticola thiotaurini TaxID=1543721 RepID=A0A558D0M7_9GAMM|nr:MAG: ATP-binding cassette domain-containing protein [Sedimenticola thiotaurini]